MCVIYADPWDSAWQTMGYCFTDNSSAGISAANTRDGAGYWFLWEHSAKGVIYKKNLPNQLSRTLIIL